MIYEEEEIGNCTDMDGSCDMMILFTKAAPAILAPRGKTIESSRDTSEKGTEGIPTYIWR